MIQPNKVNDTWFVCSFMQCDHVSQVHFKVCPICHSLYTSSEIGPLEIFQKRHAFKLISLLEITTYFEYREGRRQQLLTWSLPSNPISFYGESPFADDSPRRHREPVLFCVGSN